MLIINLTNFRRNDAVEFTTAAVIRLVIHAFVFVSKKATLQTTVGSGKEIHFPFEQPSPNMRGLMAEERDLVSCFLGKMDHKPKLKHLKTISLIVLVGKLIGQNQLVCWLLYF